MKRLRAVWPAVRILVPGDAGFGKPVMLDVCERLGVEYTFGLSANAVLQRHSEDLLAEAVRGWEEMHTSQRRFRGFAYQAGSWPAPRRVLVKAEANAQGTNRASGSRIGQGLGCVWWPRRTTTRCVARARTATRNSNVAWRWIG